MAAEAGLHTTAGATLGISASQPATFDKAGYTALTPTTIGKVNDLGTVGNKYNVVKYNTIDDRATSKRKGSYDGGTMTLKLGYDASDAGQILLKAASDDDADYSFILTLQNNAVFAFQGQVTSFEYDLGNVDKITEVTVVIELTPDPNGAVMVDIS